MELTKIVIESYKSIKKPITVEFQKGMPSIFIGKNGSGKTNVLEALSIIARANSEDKYRLNGNESIKYQAHIRLTEKDVASLLPELIYDKNKCEIIAYNSGDGLEINRLESELVVPGLKKEISDVRELASRLKDAVAVYAAQFAKIAHDGGFKSPIGSNKLTDENGELTSYNYLQSDVKLFLQQINQDLNKLQKGFADEETALNFVTEYFSSIHLYKHPPFKLEYVEPKLAKFEEKHVTINKTAIKREITKINKKTKDSCERIDALINEITERTGRIINGMDTQYVKREEVNNRYFLFLRDVQEIIGKKCLMLNNESNNMIFTRQNTGKGYYVYSFSSDSIAQTYLRQVYKGKDREQLLNNKKQFSLSSQAAKELEDYLNRNIPAFDQGMYDSISVQLDKDGHTSIFLNEKTGDEISLNETSAGRRWYFSYYFMKNLLSEGDIFIIDEPAAMLHPSAQRDILNELLELSTQGIKVVYSTHSPYLIPKDRACVNFVTMTDEGTIVNGVSSKKELVSQMEEVIGDDIFDIQTVFDMYAQGDQAKIGKKCYDAVRSKSKDLDEAASELRVSVETIKSWNRNGDHFRCPKLENVVAVSRYANIKIKDLLN